MAAEISQKTMKKHKILVSLESCIQNKMSDFCECCEMLQIRSLFSTAPDNSC